MNGNTAERKKKKKRKKKRQHQKQTTYIQLKYVWQSNNNCSTNNLSSKQENGKNQNNCEDIELWQQRDCNCIKCIAIIAAAAKASVAAKEVDFYFLFEGRKAHCSMSVQQTNDFTFASPREFQAFNSVLFFLFFNFCFVLFFYFLFLFWNH